MPQSVKIDSICHQIGDAVFDLCRIFVPQTEDDGVISVHEHGGYELHFAKRDFYFRMIDTEIPLKAGDFLILKPNTLHYGLGANWEADSFQIYLRKGDGKKGFYDCFKQLLAQNCNTVLSGEEKLCACVSALAEIPSVNSIKNYCNAQLLFAEFLNNLFEILKLDANKTFSGTEENQLLILETLMHDMGSSLQDISQKLGYSPRHLSRLIQATYGMTFTEFRRKKSISAAKRFMEVRKDLSLMQIAELSRFSSVTAMKKALKEDEK